MNSFVILVNLKPSYGEGRAPGYPAAGNADVPIWGEAKAAGSGEPGRAQSPASGLNGIPLKESPSHDKQNYMPFPNVLSQGSDADSVLCTLSL